MVGDAMVPTGTPVQIAITVEPSIGSTPLERPAKVECVSPATNTPVLFSQSNETHSETLGSGTTWERTQVLRRPESSHRGERMVGWPSHSSHLDYWYP